VGWHLFLVECCRLMGRGVQATLTQLTSDLAAVCDRIPTSCTQLLTAAAERFNV